MKYSLNQVCSIPYMSMEIQGIGNIDKQTKEVIMYFEKVSLRSLINFNFFPDAKINLPLEFLIIDGEKLYRIWRIIWKRKNFINYKDFANQIWSGNNFWIYSFSFWNF